MSDERSSPRDENFADDILLGAAAIAEFMFGHRRYRRKVYHLVATSRLPMAHLGSQLCARKSRIEAWLAEQEQRGWNGPGKEKPDGPDEEDPDKKKT